jgi:hypothetical protein
MHCVYPGINTYSVASLLYPNHQYLRKYTQASKDQFRTSGLQ